MRRVLVSLLAACGATPTPPEAPAPQVFELGPFELAPGQELADQCVSVTLNNDEPLYINAVALETAPGVHHSNWFWVPDRRFGGGDGVWTCADRGFDEAVAGLEGGVLFAQSTQATDEFQQFADGVAIVIPPHARIVAGLHLLNPSDATQHVPLRLTITPIAEPTTMLAAMSFTNMAIALPPHRRSRFTVECDVDSPHQNVLGRPVDFSLYYALPHYHDLGTGITLDAVRADGSAVTMFTTDARIGDPLGGAIAPAFSMAGFTKIRFSCDYDNPRDEVVRWGIGDQEMCVFLAFTDSTYTWAGGALTMDDPGTAIDHGDVLEHVHDCTLIPAEANR